MKLTTEQTDHIKKAFQSMKTKEELLALLNYVKAILFNESSIPYGKAKLFQLKNLNLQIKPKLYFKRYTRFSIKKKSGAERIIHAPIGGLKTMQKCLNVIFQTVYTVGPHATGFVPNRNIVDNAKVHAGNIYVYNIDLKDFFPSIDQARIWGRLKYPPFILNEESGRLELNNMIAYLCCHKMEVERINEQGEWVKEKRQVLPQGAPTSPVLSNIICERLDYLLYGVAKKFGLKYTRYADDITFSSMHSVYQNDGEFVKEIQRIITEQGFHIKESKTRLQKQGYRQEVTGLVVNANPNVQKRYIKQLRKWLYLWETYGRDKAQNLFENDYLSDSNYRKRGNPDLENVIQGKLDFLRMVKGKDNLVYLGLKKRLDVLIMNDNPLNNILVTWETKSIEEAMKDFYKLINF
jgi:RNA-directed DNA polymerase